MADEQPVTIVPTSTPPSTFGAEQRECRHDEHDEHTGKQRREDHFAQRGLGDDIDAGAVLGLLGALQDAGLGLELAAHFQHHGARGLAHRIHAEGDEEERQQAADEEADDDLRILERKFELAAVSAACRVRACNSST